MRKPGKVEDAKLFLVMLLDEGPLSQHAVREKAAAHGHAFRTIERAKVELGIVSTRHGFGPGSVVKWSLPTFTPSAPDAYHNDTYPDLL